MKRIFRILLSSVLALSFVMGAAACNDAGGEITGGGEGGDGGEDNPPPAPAVSVTITGAESIGIGAGRSRELVATVRNATDTSLTWSVSPDDGQVSLETEGNGGKCTVSVDSAAVARRDPYTVTATSVADPTKSDSVTVDILNKIDLTQEMLTKLGDSDRLKFDGWIDIELWTLGSHSHFDGSRQLEVSTALGDLGADGEYWYAEYQDSSGMDRNMYVKNVDGYANQVSLSFHNQEEYTVMEENGQPVTWEESGYYNCFEGLTVDDFTFDEETYYYKYTGSDPTLVARMIASANPYSFIPDTLSLEVRSGRISAVIATSKDDRTLDPSYIARMTLRSTVQADEEGSEIEVPRIYTFPHEDFHEGLQQAIDNFKSATSYTVKYESTMVGSTVTLEVSSDYNETVTPDLVYYAVPSEDGESVIDEYGFKKTGEDTYNTFFRTYENGIPGDFEATRVHKGNIAECKPTFDFAPEIFTYHTVDEEAHQTTYFADMSMAQVASTFYKGALSDDDLYGIYATTYTRYGSDGGLVYTPPYITVDDETHTIVDAWFYYDMYIMFGAVELTFGDYNTAEITTMTGGDADSISFTPRAFATSWEDARYIRNVAASDNEDRMSLTSLFEEVLDTDAENVPFFAEVLGDTYGFALPSVYAAKSVNRSYLAVNMYFEVPVDLNFTLQGTLEALRDYFEKAGFTKTAEDEYRKGTLGVYFIDSALDLNIYLWTYAETGSAV